MRKRLTWYRERRHDPAICVEDIARDVVAHAVDGLANQVVGSDQDARDEQDCARRPVVQLEKRRVNVGLVALVADLDESGHGHEKLSHSHD